MRAALSAALPKAGVAPDRCAALLLPGLTDDNDALRHAALNALLSAPAIRQAVVSGLGPLLKDNNPNKRERAIRALGRIGPAAIDELPAMLAATRAANGAPVYAEALAEIGPKALPALLDILQKSKPAEAKWVLPVLQNFGPSAMPVLSEALQSTNPELRAAAAAAVGEMGRDGAVAAPRLFALSKDANPTVQTAALRALVALHADPGRLKPLLETALTSESPDVRKAAAAGVASLGGAATLGVDGLLVLLSDDNAPGRLAAVQALGELGAKAAPAVDSLLVHLDDPALQSSIMETLEKMGPSAAPAVPRLVEVGKSGKQRATILPVLTAIGRGATAALPLIYASLRDENSDTRAQAVPALAAIETDKAKALAALTPLVASSQGSKVKKAAAHALAKVWSGGQCRPVPDGSRCSTISKTDPKPSRPLKSIGVRTVPDLVAMLSVHDERVRTFACDLLGTMGPDARDAAPKLREIASQDDSVRASANAALKKIDPTAP